MADLGFVRNEFARSLRAGHSRMLGYVMLDARNPFFTDVANSIEEVVEKVELSLILCSSDGRPEREAKHLDLLTEQRVHAILLTPVDPDAPVLARAVDRGVPLVLVDRISTRLDVCSVSVDNVQGGRLAIEHLVERGHRRVALAGGPIELGQIRDRFDGASRAWEEAGLDPAHMLVVETTAMDVPQGRRVGRLLTDLDPQQRPTAVFCANDLLALGVLQHSAGVGVAVPEDLAIVGYDDIEFAAAAAVPLTSIRQPREDIGRTAAALALEESDGGEHRHRQVVFAPELIARRSTGHTPTSTP